jgi:hypothetical protein
MSNEKIDRLICNLAKKAAYNDRNIRLILSIKVYLAAIKLQLIHCKTPVKNIHPYMATAQQGRGNAEYKNQPMEIGNRLR